MVDSEHIVPPHESNQEHLPHVNVLHLAEVVAKVIGKSVDLLLRKVALTLLGPKHNHIVFLMIRNHLRKLNVLGISCHVPGLNVDV